MFSRRTPMPGPSRATPRFRRDGSSSGRTGTRPLAIVVVALIVIAACGPSVTVATPSPTTTGTPPASQAAGPSASPTTPPDPATVYAAIEPQVVAIRGLQPKATVEPKLLDDAGLKKLVTTSFSKDNPPEIIAANGRLLKMLGLLDPAASLGDLYIELLGSQVAGLYNPDDKQLYVVSRTGAIGPTEKVTFAHEYTHALQDQNFNLKGLALDQIGEGDRSLARLSLVEGDATLLMSYWATANLSQAETFQMLGESLNPESTKILTDMPAVLRESLLFPYTSGLQFVQGLQATGGWTAVDDAFARPPASTEQVLHPDKYVANEAPLAVSLPKDLASRLGAGWKVGLEDTLGEFSLKVWLANAGGGKGAATAQGASAGWGGDRVALLDGPDGATAVAISTTWDTASDAAEFATAAGLVVDGLTQPGGVLAPAGGTTVTVVIASSADLVGRVENALGLAG
jgi:hypothetical protein